MSLPTTGYQQPTDGSDRTGWRTKWPFECDAVNANSLFSFFVFLTMASSRLVFFSFLGFKFDLFDLLFVLDLGPKLLFFFWSAFSSSQGRRYLSGKAE